MRDFKKIIICLLTIFLFKDFSILSMEKDKDDLKIENTLIKKNNFGGTQIQIFNNLKKITGLILCIALTNDETDGDNIVVVSSGTGFIIKQFSKNVINIMSSAHVFDWVTEKEKMNKNFRFFWFFVPTSSVNFKGNIKTIADEIIDKIKQDIKIKDPFENYYDYLHNIYMKQEIPIERFKSKDTNINKEVLEPGTIVFNSEKQDFLKQTTDFDCFLLTDLNFPLSSKINFGEAFMGKNGNNDIVIAKGNNLGNGHILASVGPLDFDLEVNYFKNKDEFGEKYIKSKAMAYSFGYKSQIGVDMKGSLEWLSIDKIQNSNTFLTRLENAGKGTSGSPIITCRGKFCELLGVIHGRSPTAATGVNTRATFLDIEISEQLLPKVIKINEEIYD